jgi:chaperonin GroES
MMSSAIRPLNEFILVRYRSRNTGLVYIPEFVEHQERVADVVAVGHKVRHIKVGDAVMTFEGVEGVEVEDCNLLEEDLIMGIMDGNFPMPYGERLIVLPDEHPDEIGGIIIPDIAKEKVLVGTVVAAGAGKYYDDKFVPNETRKGDRVLYGKYAGGYDGFKIEGVPHLSMRDEDIIMVLED